MFILIRDIFEQKSVKAFPIINIDLSYQLMQILIFICFMDYFDKVLSERLHEIFMIFIRYYYLIVFDFQFDMVIYIIFEFTVRFSTLFDMDFNILYRSINIQKHHFNRVMEIVGI